MSRTRSDEDDYSAPWFLGTGQVYAIASGRLEQPAGMVWVPMSGNRGGQRLGGWVSRPVGPTPPRPRRPIGFRLR